MASLGVDLSIDANVANFLLFKMIFIAIKNSLMMGKEEKFGSCFQKSINKFN